MWRLVTVVHSDGPNFEIFEPHNLPDLQFVDFTRNKYNKTGLDQINTMLILNLPSRISM